MSTTIGDDTKPIKLRTCSSKKHGTKKESKNSIRIRSSLTNINVNGRRGPGIYRNQTYDINSFTYFQNIRSVLTANNRVGHFKPSLTPGLGTRRIICTNSNQDPNLKFTIEPRQDNEAFQEWLNSVRYMARLGDGLPTFIRPRVWSALVDRQLAKQHADWDHIIKMSFKEASNRDDERLGEQIVKDLHRTGCDQFGSDEDKASLKRVLLAYARWNKRVGYCQGFNVIAAAILDVMGRDEEKTFKIMVYLIDYVLPESYFAQNLQALSVDIAVFRYLLQKRLPHLAKHLDRLQYKAALEIDCQLGTRGLNENDTHLGKDHGAYEPPLMNVYIIQWFLTLFATCLAPDAVLRIWDSILLEGSEVILRTAIVMMDFLSSRLLKLKSADQFYATMSDLLNEFAVGRIVSTQELLFEIYELAPFPYPGLSELREKFMYNINPLVLQTTCEQHQERQKRMSENINGSKRDKFYRFNLFKFINSTSRKSDYNQTNENGIRKIDKLQINFGKDLKNQEIRTSGDNNGKSHITTKNNTTNEKVKVNPLQINSVNQSKCLSNETENIGDMYQEISLVTEKEVDSSHGSSNKLHNNNKLMKRSKSVVESKEITNEQNLTIKCWSPFWSQTTTNDLDQQSQYSIKSEILPKQKKIQISNFHSLRNSPLKQKEKIIISPGSDISELGPGAVSDTPRMRPRSETSSIDQARRTTDLDQLKLLYLKHQAKQKSTILVLPGLLNSQSDSRNSFNHLDRTCLITVLPQKKHISVENEHKKNSRKLITNEDKQKQTNNEINTNSVHKSESSMFKTVNYQDNYDLTIASQDEIDSEFNSVSLDPDLIGAIRSWQEKAIWSSCPINSNNECEQSIHLLSNKTITTDDNNMNMNVNKPKLCQLAAHANLHSFEQVTHKSESQVEILKSTDGQLKQSKSYSNIQCNPPKNMFTKEILLEMIKSHNESSKYNEWSIGKTRNSCKVNDNITTTTTNNNNNSNNNNNNTDDSFANFELISSISTSICQDRSKKFPWDKAAASFIAKPNLKHLPNTNINKLSNLTKNRKTFGAQFGIYKNLDSVKSNLGSGFIDRVQLAEWARLGWAR